MFGIFGKRKPKTRGAGVYQYPDFLIIHAEHKTTVGVSIAALPFVRVSTTATAEEVGHSLRQMLESYRENVPHPADWKGFGKEFLKEVGFRSWQALYKSAKSCFIAETAGNITFTPARNGGYTGKDRGFQSFDAELIVVPSGCTDSELGDALIRALKVSE